MVLTERSVELLWLISHIGRPKRILDIGSADGVYVNLLYELCRDLYLCDTRKLRPSVPAQVYVGSAHQLPPTWTGFDLVTCLSVLDHIGLDAYGNVMDSELIDSVLTTIERVTVRGGRLLLTVPFGRYQVTQHPGGGQTVFDQDTLFGLFPDDLWLLKSYQTWCMRGDHYEPCAIADVADAGYVQWRAEACIAMELERI